ncbi:MAG: ABC transporter ATP-binding protein [Anaerolineae bacterium]|nr:ABC transporter ATP-binding protein [Anaerolineae bacterium]
MIEIKGLTKAFDTLVAVDDITLTVQPAEVLALLGPNGAGKTTTVRMLSAILKPTAGRARVAGYDVVTQANEVRRNVGMLTEAPGLYSRMTGREYLDFFGQLREIPTPQRRVRINDLAEWFKITHAADHRYAGSHKPVLDRRLGEYSKGMAQKIALIRTLLHDPPVLLLDEPTSAMDPASARLVRDTIAQLRNDARRAIILCTHNLPEAEALADRIAIIRQGRIVEHDATPTLKARLLGPPLMELRLAKPSQNGVISLIESVVARNGAQVQDVGNGWIRYSTPDPAVTNPAVLQALTAAGVAVMTLSEVAQSLEAVYLRAVEENV